MDVHSRSTWVWNEARLGGHDIHRKIAAPLKQVGATLDRFDFVRFRDRRIAAPLKLDVGCVSDAWNPVFP
jgi:hypothetical protein